MKIVKTFGCKINVLYRLFSSAMASSQVISATDSKTMPVSLSLLFNVVADMWGKLIAANRLLIAVSLRPQNSNAEKKQE